MLNRLYQGLGNRSHSPVNMADVRFRLYRRFWKRPCPFQENISATSNACIGCINDDCILRRTRHCMPYPAATSSHLQQHLSPLRQREARVCALGESLSVRATASLSSSPTKDPHNLSPSSRNRRMKSGRGTGRRLGPNTKLVDRQSDRGRLYGRAARHGQNSSPDQPGPARGGNTGAARRSDWLQARTTSTYPAPRHATLREDVVQIFPLALALHFHRL